MVTPDVTTVELTERDLDNGQRLASVLFAFGKQQATVSARMSKAGVDRTAIIMLKTLVMVGPCRSSTLAETIHSDPSTVSRQVAALVKEGLIERRADPEDGRASLLAPTDAGVALLQANRARFAMSLARMVRHWEPADLDRFIELFERFLDDHDNYLPTLISECANPVRSEGGNS
ncbi:Transcriptional regulator, MarR family [Alloactinosynnema sp. L-07]|uniref:MarR family winged helix-turn-helix transcriptional regulator n=1 Tax=Alloactinosynnema sp. L-07 TaxID=1653480 RepID=UPI00065F0423|nr:MarR family winged helix-turn-helix transcriptional regulator [Alloactinosynnema sp. L-07]CRK61123.1 Transcriptional regulator, MarR family [Alloactinosynnema sp. L-07]